MPGVIEIDGACFSSLGEFYDHFGQRALNAPWGKNLDAFNDVLRGGFGTPVGGFRLVWRNHALSKVRLGHQQTVRELKARLERCHPDNRKSVAAEIERAMRGEGDTAYDWLVQIIRVHGPGGHESEDNVILELS